MRSRPSSTTPAPDGTSPLSNASLEPNRTTNASLSSRAEKLPVPRARRRRGGARSSAHAVEVVERQPENDGLTAEFEAMLEQAREYRAQVDELPDEAEIVDGAIRAEVKFLPHPPEPPPRHGRLIADILELLRDEQLPT